MDPLRTVGFVSLAADYIPFIMRIICSSKENSPQPTTSNQQPAPTFSTSGQSGLPLTTFILKGLVHMPLPDCRTGSRTLPDVHVVEQHVLLQLSHQLLYIHYK